MKRISLAASLAPFVVILHRPENAMNVGAVARAMKNMGFARLRLVQPVALDQATAQRVAHRAEEILDEAQVFDSLDDALADAVYVVGTAADDHPEHPQTAAVRAVAANLIVQAAAGPVALLFGAEANGLGRDALDRCHLILSLPTEPAHVALNLAQAVVLVLYEVRMAAQDARERTPAPAPAPKIAEQASLERLFAFTEELLTDVDFIKYNPAAVLRTLRQIVYRAQLRPDELALLMAALRQVQWELDRRNSLLGVAPADAKAARDWGKS